MSQPTNHGNNIVQQIQTEDSYGEFNVLSLADVWNIVDNLHTHFMDNSDVKPLFDDKILEMLGSWLRQLENMDSELPPL